MASIKKEKGELESTMVLTALLMVIVVSILYYCIFEYKPDTSQKETTSAKKKAFQEKIRNEMEMLLRGSYFVYDVKSDLCFIWYNYGSDRINRAKYVNCTEKAMKQAVTIRALEKL